jgi:uncharacterized protein (TIGR00299 family) protein
MSKPERPGTLMGATTTGRAPGPIQAPDPRGQHLHFDCASGAAGDMMLGALLDLGVPLDVIGDALDAIGAGRGRLAVNRVVKHGIAATDVKVDTSGHVLAEQHAVDPQHQAKPKKRLATDPGSSGGFLAIKFRAETHERHVHVDEVGDKSEELHEHGHYRYADIRLHLEESALSDSALDRALDIFERLARAEAKLHGTTIEDVMFHELGAIDSIVDIVGTAAALDWLRPGSVTCASVAMGHGTVRSAHGMLPVPAPAAVEVLREAGGVMADGGIARELCTPTGAAILASAVTAWQPPPPGKPIAVGWGAGDADLPDRPNVLRAMTLAAGAAKPDTVWQIDANLDDMSPELAGHAGDALFAAGALDVWWTPITMKKGRPALTLSVLCEADVRDQLIATMLRETTTIGVRYAELQRTVLVRQIVEVQTRYGRIPVKVALDGTVVRNAAPEYEACAAAARAHGVPVKLVFAAALAAYSTK